MSTISITIDKTDGRLVKRYLEKKDEAAVRSLLERHGGLIYSTARRLSCGDEQSAHDITQAVWLLFLKKAPKLTGMQNLAGWLYRSTCFVAKAWRRRETRRPDPAKMHERGTEMPGQDTEQEKREALLHLDEALASLGASFRDVIVLHYLEGLSVEEAGRKLGIPSGTVRSRLGRAVQKLRKRLSRKGVATGAAVAVSVLSSARAEAAPAALSSQMAAVSSGAAAVPVSIVSLAEGGMTMALIAKVKAVAAVAAVALSAVAGGTLILGGSAIALREPDVQEVAAEEADETTEAREPASVVGTDPEPVAEKQEQPAEKEPREKTLRQKLAARVTFDFVDTTALEAVQFLQTISGVSFVIGPEAVEQLHQIRVNLEMTGVPLENALTNILRLAGLDYALRKEAVYISTPEDIKDVSIRPVPGDTAAQINPDLRVTFEFVDTPLPEAADFLSAESELQVVLDPAIAEDAAKRTINLKVENMPLDAAVKWIARLSDFELIVEPDRFILHEKKDNPVRLDSAKDRNGSPEGGELVF